MKNKIEPCLRIFALLVITAALASCAPMTFVRTMSPGWNAIEIRKDLSYDNAWNSVVDLISKEFDIEIISKEDGYLRTGWLYTWTGKLSESYKVRAVVKFSVDRKQVEVKSEAHHYATGFLGVGEGWVMGTDERLMTTLRTDIMGKVSRISR